MSSLLKNFKRQALPKAIGLGILLVCLTSCGQKQTNEELSPLTPSKKPLPRFEMTKTNEANARLAPYMDAPKLATYRKAGFPIQVISETRNFRLVCDPDGKTYWMSAGLLRASNKVFNAHTTRIELTQKPLPGAPVVAHLRPRSLAILKECRAGYCLIEVDKKSLWADEKKLWGVQKTPQCARKNAPNAPVIALSARQNEE